MPERKQMNGSESFSPKRHKGSGRMTMSRAMEAKELRSPICLSFPISHEFAPVKSEFSLSCGEKGRR
jgi:hypothetical protein